MIPVLSAMNPADAGVPHTFDFSKLLAAGDTIASVASVTASPAGLTVGTGTVVAGLTAGCAVQCALGGGAAGVTYTVTAEIVSAAGVQLARSAFVPVGAV